VIENAAKEVAPVSAISFKGRSHRLRKSNCWPVPRPRERDHCEMTPGEAEPTNLLGIVTV
jgi:hypothetical protein